MLSSNAGHALFAGIASPERAARLARLLTGKSFFSGWGVRTIAAGEARYNPMSYHNGSVWPHDNALIAMGLARYGHKEAVLTIFQGLAEAAVYDEFRRLPELFCGFSRRRKRGPTSYPVACSPQAWAAAAPFALVAAATGLDLDHASGGVRLVHPALARLPRRPRAARRPRRRRPARSAPVARRRRRHHRDHPARGQGRADDREMSRRRRFTLVQTIKRVDGEGPAIGMLGAAMTDRAILSCTAPAPFRRPASHAWHWWTHEPDAARLHRW